MPQTWVQRLDWFPCEIELRRPPVQSVTSVEYVDTAGSTQTLASSRYQLDASSAPGRLRPAYGDSWPTIRLIPNAVTITFVAGYLTAAAVPAIAKRLILLACEEDYYGCDVSMSYDSLVSRLRWGGYV